MEDELRLYDCGCMEYADSFYDTEYCDEADALHSRWFDALLSDSKDLMHVKKLLHRHFELQQRRGNYRDVPWSEVFH